MSRKNNRNISSICNFNFEIKILGVSLLQLCFIYTNTYMKLKYFIDLVSKGIYHI